MRHGGLVCLPMAGTTSVALLLCPLLPVALSSNRMRESYLFSICHATPTFPISYRVDISPLQSLFRTGRRWLPVTNLRLRFYTPTTCPATVATTFLNAARR
jgi:hypothetical protein